MSVLAYCLMTNHVHWVVVPERAESLAVLFRRVHGAYAQAVNAGMGRSGPFGEEAFVVQLEGQFQRPWRRWSFEKSAGTAGI